MNENELEDTLKELPLEAPRQDFDEGMERLFDQARTESLERPRVFVRPWQVAAACLLCAGLGVVGSQYLLEPVPDSPAVVEKHYTTIYVIEAPASSQTAESTPVYDEDFWSRPMTTKVTVSEVPRVVNDPAEFRDRDDKGEVL